MLKGQALGSATDARQPGPQMGPHPAAADDLHRGERGPCAPRRGRRIHGHLERRDAGTRRFHPARDGRRLDRERRLGTGVVGVYTRGRALLAQQSAALADASGDRFALGIGASSDRIVEGWNGIPLERPLGKIEETVDWLRPVLAGERSAEGGFKLEAAPAEPIPVILAALQGKMLRLAVEKARRRLHQLPPARRPAPRWKEGLAGAPDDFELLCRFFCLAGPREQAEPLARFMFASYITVPFYEALRWLGHGEAIDEMVEAWGRKDREAAIAAAPWELIADTFIFGEPEEMVDRLEGLRRGRHQPARHHPDHDAGQARRPDRGARATLSPWSSPTASAVTGASRSRQRGRVVTTLAPGCRAAVAWRGPRTPTRRAASI